MTKDTPKFEMRPADYKSPVTAPRSLSELESSLARFVADESEVRKEYPWAERFVMGLPLAPWQRPACWSDLQAERFIQSLWHGFDAGSYLLNEIQDISSRAEGGIEYKLFSNIVLDGQQRLHTLERYLTNQLQVKDIHGNYCRWCDLDRVSKVRFGRIIFPRSTFDSSDERELRLIYDLRSFGGTPHQESERASKELA